MPNPWIAASTTNPTLLRCSREATKAALSVSSTTGAACVEERGGGRWVAGGEGAARTHPHAAARPRAPPPAPEPRVIQVGHEPGGEERQGGPPQVEARDSD